MLTSTGLNADLELAFSLADAADEIAMRYFQSATLSVRTKIDRTPVSEADEAVEIDVKRPLDKVIPVRMSSEKWEELRREARELGVGPTTLARMWILEKLGQVLLSKKSA